MTVIESVLRYLARGWQPIRIPRVGTGVDAAGKSTLVIRSDGRPTKGPLIAGWQQTKFTARDVTRTALPDDPSPTRFHDTDNVGLLLGIPSGGLVDIDIDCPEAEYLAPQLLPPTHLIGGREKRRRTHWWYKIPPPCGQTKKFQTPTYGTLIEFRSTGGQTVVAPSVHPDDGDRYCWDEEGEPLETDGKDLLKRVHAIAIGCLLARTWPAEGARHDAALPVAGFLAQMGWPEEDAAALVYHTAIAAGHRNPADRRDTVRSTYRKLAANQPCQGTKTLRQFFGDEVVNAVTEWSRQIYQPAAYKAVLPELETTSVADIEVSPTRWLYYPYLPLGYVTVLAGDSYQGKSRITAALATSASLGAWFETDPEGESLYVPAHVLFLGSEDLPGTIKTRLENYGADITRVSLATHLRTGNKRNRFTLDMANLASLRRVVLAHGTKLVVVDPLQSFLPPGKDMNNTAHMRELFDQLGELAVSCQCAVVIVQHFSKKTDVRPEDRIAGTKDFFNCPRSVLVIVKRDDLFEEADSGGRPYRKFKHSVHMFGQLKNSIVGEGTTIEFQLEAGDNFRWIGTSTLTAHDLLAVSQDGPMSDDNIALAKKLLVSWLQGDGRKSQELLKLARAEGINQPELHTARKLLGIETHPDGIGLVWRLPGKYQSH